MVEGIKGGYSEKPLPTFPVYTFCFSYSYLNLRSENQRPRFLASRISRLDGPRAWSGVFNFAWSGRDWGHMPLY